MLFVIKFTENTVNLTGTSIGQYSESLIFPNTICRRVALEIIGGSNILLYIQEDFFESYKQQSFFTRSVDLQKHPKRKNGIFKEKKSHNS